jgi:DNA (cytosine-5)-methyltransferase 1
MKKIRTIELFAGVGGFRIGLASASNKDIKFEVVWSSQWEPGAKAQHASDIYKKWYGEDNHSCEDIEVVVKNKFNSIPDHDLLVGGFPCQDYSVARTLSQAEGLVGKKGVLWWSIYNILKKKGAKSPDFLMLENVDRLLKSPASQRGRDFAVMLSSLEDAGYAVEWRVINAAEYGFPQRRRRVYLLGYKKGSSIYKSLAKKGSVDDWIFKNGVIVTAFPVSKKDTDVVEFKLERNLAKISKEFSVDRPEKSPFKNAGIMIDGVVHTVEVEAKYVGRFMTLGDIIEDEKNVPEEYFIDNSDLSKWKKLKGAKREPRKAKSGHVYMYSEGAMPFPDPLDKAARTIVTGEGGSSPSRFKHVVKTKSGRYRRLTPVELERINMFPEHHTKGAPDVKRAFLMGNALVVGVIEKLGKSLAKLV